MALVRVFSPDSESEIVTIVAMLEAHDVPCFVHNAGFGGLYPGPQINSYNTRSIMVPEESLPVALELLQDFQRQPAEIPAETKTSSRWRTFIEFLLFGWFVPGSRRSKHE